MKRSNRTLLLVATWLLSASSLRAQSVVDPSGHWEGKVETPGSDLAFQVDLVKNSLGELTGTLSVPAQRVDGLPLTSIVIDGTSITFSARADQPLAGVISADGKSMTGTYSAEGYSLPFTAKWSGEGQVKAPPRSAPIAKTLEGTWAGTLDARGSGLRLVLTMANRPDGTAMGQIVNLDEGGLQVPVLITQEGSTVTLESKVVPSIFSGALNLEGTELSGTLHEGALEAPLTFRRAAPEGRK